METPSGAPGIFLQQLGGFFHEGLALLHRPGTTTKASRSFGGGGAFQQGILPRRRLQNGKNNQNVKLHMVGD